MMTDDVNGRTAGIHVGLIPDGNRRWAKKRGKPPWHGHIKGSKKIKDFLKWCMETRIIPIREVTVYLMSTDNVHRQSEQVSQLWKLYSREFKKIPNNKMINKHRARVNVVGDKNLWNPTFRDAATHAMNATKHYASRLVNLTVVYSGRSETLRAALKAVQHPLKRIEDFLEIKSPMDLLIRVGGQCRLSNFLLTQTAYTEIKFSKTLWPDYTKKEFESTLKWYLHQTRRFGK